MARKSPTKLANSPGRRNDSSSLWVLRQSRLQLKVLIVRQELANKPREQLGLNEREH
jgi:hypothetical protein